MSDAEISPLRVLIANERRDRLELLAQVVAGLGHEVIAREVDVKEVGPVTAREHPDVALVGLGLSSDHALELIAEIVHTSRDVTPGAIRVGVSIVAWEYRSGAATLPTISAEEFSPEPRRLTISPALQRLLHLPADQIVGKPICHLGDEIRGSRRHRALKDLIDSRGT
jgi:hypothetical protein